MRTRRIILLLIIFITSACYYKYNQWQQREDIRATLEFGHLAALPDSADDVRVDTKGGLFSRWLSFKADKAAIDKWIAKSFSSTKQAPVPSVATNYSSGDSPAWFTPVTASNHSIVYEVLYGAEQLYCMIWIDYKSKTVWIYSSYS
jgi:hypothetical protein